MARRSPTNARYQKNTGPAGKTRRSASSAKPKRAGGAQQAQPKKKPRPSLREAFRAQPSTPEMKKWRRVWWVLIGLAFTLAAITGFVPQIKDNPNLVVPMMVIYTLVLGGALYVDLRIIRKLRQEQAGAGKPEKSDKK